MIEISIPIILHLHFTWFEFLSTSIFWKKLFAHFCNRLNSVATTRLRRGGGCSAWTEEAQSAGVHGEIADRSGTDRVDQGWIAGEDLQWGLVKGGSQAKPCDEVLPKGGSRAKSCNGVCPRVDREWNPAMRFCPKVDREQSPAMVFAQGWIASEILQWGFAQGWIASKVLWWCLPKGGSRVKPCDEVLPKGGLPDG